MNRFAFALVVFTAASAMAQDFPRLSGTHPVLVTVDDLPLASNRLHPDPAERERVTRDLLAFLAT
jgi:hypothetical protein